MDYRLDAPLDELMDMASEKYSVAFEPVTAGGTTLEVLQIQNLTDLIDQMVDETGQGDALDLPFWAHIWPCAVILSHYLQRLPAQGRTLLEIGAGVGVTGLFAAAHGFQTIISDIAPEALLFARINVLKNSLEDMAEVRRVDFSTQRLAQKFDVIIGAEVLYIENLHRNLIRFLLAHVKRDSRAEVVLGRDYRRKATRFMKLADKEFRIQTKTVGSVAKDDKGSRERYLSAIMRLTPRKIDRPA